MTGPSTLVDPIDDDDIAWVCELMKLAPLDEPRRQFLKTLSTVDVSACPGSGKTTLVVAKLAILARKWKSATRGICVLSHTNVAREEIEHRLGSTDIGQRLLGYPHFIDTIHGFVNRFLAIPWLLSAGYRVAAIDNEITNKVRRRHLGERNYATLDTYLKRKHMSFDDLRLSSSNFTTPLAGSTFPAGPDTSMHKLATSALRHAAEQGYFCYDEIFLLGDALLAQQPALPAILSHRFPIVFIDEMQDTSEQQSAFLRRLFPRDSHAICVQRVGDPNQAIFEGGSKPTADGFPDQDASRCLSIASSFRFDSSIASLASPFAYLPVQPSGLQGLRANIAPNQEPQHTIFLFPDNDTSQVLDAFGRHVLASVPATLIGTAPVTAIGAVHKPFEDVTPGHAHYPKTVAHYWGGYQTGMGKKVYHPGTLAEYFLAAQSVIQSGGPVHQCVESVAFGITHLANLLAGGSHIKARARHHRQIEDKISIHTDEKAFYRSILTRFLIEHEPLSQELWTTLCPTLRALAAALGGGDANSTVADPFLAWPQSPKASVLPIPSDVNAPSPNVYRVSDGGASVDIRLSSIHIAKGQTHLATLILETYNHKHVLNSLMPWLLGNHQNGTKCTSDQAAQRLYQTYVAMTRPTHLLCLAMRNSSLGTGNAFATNQAQLIDRGWKIRHLTSAQAVKTNGYAPAIFP